MRKTFLIVAIILISLILFVLFVAPPSSLIHLKSNVPISLDEIFPKVNKFYLIYKPVVSISMSRRFLSVYVEYNEPVYGCLKFIDGEFAITEKGNIIRMKNKNNCKVTIYANFENSHWDNEYKMLFVNLLKNDMINKIEQFVVYSGEPAFYDKNGILVIMGNLDFKNKAIEYKKVLEFYKYKLKQIKEVDLRFKNEAIIKWREPNE